MTLNKLIMRWTRSAISRDIFERKEDNSDEKKTNLKES